VVFNRSQLNLFTEHLVCRGNSMNSRDGGIRTLDLHKSDQKELNVNRFKCPTTRRGRSLISHKIRGHFHELSILQNILYQLYRYNTLGSLFLSFFVFIIRFISLLYAIDWPYIARTIIYLLTHEFNSTAYGS